RNDGLPGRINGAGWIGSDSASRLWVVDRWKDRGEISGLHRIGRIRCVDGAGKSEIEALPGTEEESPIPANPSAEIGAELILVVFGTHHMIAVVEERICVQIGVTKIFPESSVECVCPALGRKTDRASSRPSDFGP